MCEEHSRLRGEGLGVGWEGTGGRTLTLASAWQRGQGGQGDRVVSHSRRCLHPPSSPGAWKAREGFRQSQAAGTV